MSAINTLPVIGSNELRWRFGAESAPGTDKAERCVMLTHSTIYRTPATYASFPYICGDANGGQLCVFRQAGAATAEMALDNRHTHQDRDSKIMLARRPAGQKDWTAAETVIGMVPWLTAPERREWRHDAAVAAEGACAAFRRVPRPSPSES